MDIEALPDAAIAHYRLVKKLGEGGMSEVFLAQDERLNRPVAIKILKQPLKSEKQPQRAARLKREAKAMAQLSHANVVRVYDFIDDDPFALVMEYVHGVTLDQAIKERGPNLKQRLLWLIQIAEGLAAAHNAGLVHRDLKPENILIDEGGVAKITDFGIARVTSADVLGDDASQLTAVGGVVGTCYVMSPEQALGEALDEKSDLFALGIVAFVVLCGKHPFSDSRNPNVVVQAILNQAPQIPSVLNASLPDSLNTLLEALLQKNKLLRPESAAMVAQWLRRIFVSLPTDSVDAFNSETATMTLDSAMYISHVSGAWRMSSGETEKAQGRGGIGVASLIQKLRERKWQWRFFWVCIVLACALLSVAFLQATPVRPNETLVAILPTEFKDQTGQGVAEQTRLILADVVNQDLARLVLETDSLNLVDLDVPENQSMQDYARSYGVGEILKSVIVCDRARCQMQLSRLVLQEAQARTDSNWVVTKTQHWPILIDDHYLNVISDLQIRFAAIYDLEPQARQLATLLNEETYRAFVHLRYEVLHLGQETHAAFEQLLSFQLDLLTYTPFLELLVDLGLKRFDDSQNSYYTETLNSVLAQADKLLSHNKVIMQGRFELALRAGAFDAAKQWIDLLAQHRQDPVAILSAKALLANYQGAYERAANLYDRALKLRPSVPLYYDAAYNQIYAGHHQQAEAYLQALLALAPNDYNAVVLRASLLLTLGQLDQAIDLYANLIDTNEEAQHYSNLGIAYLLQGKHQQALAVFERANALAADNPRVLANLADALQLTLQKDKAQAMYQRVVDLIEDRPDADMLGVAAQAHAHLGHESAALTLLHDNLKQGEDNAFALYDAALVYTLTRQWPSALLYVEKSLAMGLNRVWYDLPWFDALCAENHRAVWTSLVGTARCPTP